MNDIQSIFGYCINSYLSDCAEIPECLADLVSTATARLLDSEIIIEDNFQQMQSLAPAKAAITLEKFEQVEYLDELIEAIKLNGFAEQFHSVIGLFGSIMMSLCASEEQIRDVEQWVEQGHFGHFMMTDSGGPSLQNWQSRLTQLEIDGQFKLKVNKKWVIEGHSLGFGMVVCQQQSKPYPVTVLLSPEKMSQLKSEACGEKFLDQRLQLGNVSGEVKVKKTDFLSKGGLASVNRFLTLVRPRFVMALMNHLTWLHANNRLELTPNDILRQQTIKDIAKYCSDQETFSIHSVDRVLALKFASNEFLQHLVLNRRVLELSDQRDLLGFSKMEGSSYRCFHEIYSKFKRSRK